MRVLSRLGCFFIFTGIAFFLFPASRLVAGLGIDSPWGGVLFIFIGLAILISPSLINIIAGDVSGSTNLSKLEYKRIDEHKEQLIDRIGTGDSIQDVVNDVCSKAEVTPDKVKMYLDSFAKVVHENQYLSTHFQFGPFVEKYDEYLSSIEHKEK